MNSNNSVLDSFEVQINIPKDYVLVKRDYLEELQMYQKDQSDWVSGMAWLVFHTPFSSYKTLKNKILFPYREELEDECVIYPKTKNEKWQFHQKKMKHWLDHKLPEILSK